VACPFFRPVARLEDGAWPQAPRVPLGDPCRGYCTAHADESVTPGAEELRSFCNTGYVKGRCGRFPNLPDVPDAIRFSLEQDCGGSLTLMYIEEKEYAPLRFGTLSYDVLGGTFAEQSEPENLRAQGHMFATSYLTRKVKP
jgi:hypothetical protein